MVMSMDAKYRKAIKHGEYKRQTSWWQQSLVLLLTSLQLWQPFMMAAYAAEVMPTNAGVSLNQAANAVPIVNIATPGTAGISHNTYSQFNVGSNGLILNNSAQPVNTQLGGYVPGNANMAGGPARLILNEVTSANPSHLNGYMEVAGQKADVIVANPYGISCRGCGFINTAKATLSTGKPFFNSDGSLGGFDVKGGTLSIDEGGLNASNTESLALYTRVLELNAALYAKNLQIVAGSNRINADGSYSPIATTDTAPAYAIDSSALGGMYANTITLVGTEAGVGMRLSGPVAALTGKLEILSNGDVRLVRASAAQSVNIKVAGDLAISSDGDTERDGISAGGNVKLEAAGTLSLSEMTALTGAATTIAANQIEAASDSEIAARGNLGISAAIQHYDGTIGSTAKISLAGTSIGNSGNILASTGLGINTTSLLNSGSLQSQQGDATVAVSGLFNNQNGQLQSGGTLTINSTQLDNTQGQVASEGALTVTTTAGDINNSEGLLQGNSGVTISADKLDNRGGQLVSNAAITLTLPNGLANQNGLVETTGSFSLSQAVVLQNSNGVFRTGQDLSLYLPAFDHMQSGGTFSSQGLLRLESDGDIALNAATFETPGALQLVSAQGDIAIAGRVVSGGNAAFTAKHIFLDENSLLIGLGTLTAATDTLDNLGVIYGRDGLALTVTDTLNNGAQDGNHDAALLSEGDISITGVAGARLRAINNYAGLIETRGGDITLKADSLKNINLGWSVSALTTSPVYSYSPSQTHWDTFYFHGNSGDSYKRAYRYTTITDYFVVDQGSAATIIADGEQGNIFIAADKVTNDRSVISASNLLDINAASIVNTGTAVTDVTTVKTDYRYHWCKSSTGHGEKCNNESGSEANQYMPGNTTVIPAVLEGGKQVDLHGSIVNGVAEQTKKTVMIDDGNYSGLDTDPAATPILGGQAPDILDPSASAGFHLPGNGIFHINPPGHPYLIESDPAFNTYAGFLGSAYLIGQLAWGPDITQRRLGDSYYELTLIREALLASIGSRFLDPAIADEKAQYEYLMQNAIAAAESLHLTPGISLSRAQIDALQQDIVWMEERSIAGESVLVPVVYLAQGSLRLLNDGAVIGGGSLSIAGDSLSNSGMVRARDSIHIDVSGDIQNLGGSLSAGTDLVLQSGGDILNESGHLSGNNVLLQAEGDITHRTWSQREDFSAGASQAWTTLFGDTADVQAKEALLQIAGGDIRLMAATLKGKDILLEAGGDVTLETVKNEQGDSHNGSNWQFTEEHVRYLTTQIEAAQNISISAGQDITAIAASIRAKADVELSAGHSVNLLAAEETSHLEDHRQQKDTLSESTYDMVHNESRTVGSYIEAGGNIAIRAEAGDVTLYASRAKASGQADVYAAGNINLIAGVDTVSHSEEEKKSSAATFKNHQEGYVSQKAVASGISASGDLNLDAGRDVNIIASTLYSDAVLRIGGAEVEQASLRSISGKPLNLNVSTLELTNESWDETQKGLKGPLESFVKALSFVVASQIGAAAFGQVEMPEITIGEHSKTRSKETLQAGSVLSAQSMSIKIQGTATLIGADVSVKDTLAVSAKDIVIDAAAETSTYSHEEGKDSVKGLGAELNKEKGEYRIAGVQETKTSISDTQSLTQWRGTSINAGQLVLQAENNIDILGSQLKVTGDALIAAGENLTIGGREGNIAQTHEESVETITTSVSVRNAYVDAALAVKGLSEATEALKDAKRALDEAERKAELGQLAAEDVNFFRANVVAAGINLAQAEVAAAGAVVAMSATGGSGGFYASGSAQREKTVTSSTSQHGIWQGSNLLIGGNAALIAGETLSIKGSDLVVDKAALADADQAETNRNLLLVDARNIALTAGTEQSSQSSKTRTDQESGSISLNADGITGSNLNAGYHETDADSRSLHYVNSHLRAGTISSQSDALYIAGAVVEADHIDIRTGELSVISLQDETYSKSKSQGITLGMGFGNTAGKGQPLKLEQTSKSGSLDYQKSEAERKWVAEQSGIIGHDTISIAARDTTLIGALIANASRGSGGELIEQGGLALTTDTLTINHLFDTDTSKTVGGSVGISISNVPASKANGTESNAPLKNGEAGSKPVPHNTTTIGGTYYGHVTEQTTNATIGGGSIVVGGQALSESNASTLGLESLNRELTKAQEITRNEDTGGLNATTTIDNRIFSSEGLEDMKHEQKLAGSMLALGGIYAATTGTVLIKTVTDKDVALENVGEVLTGSLGQLQETQEFVSKNAKAAAQIEAHVEGENQNLEATQAATNLFTQQVSGESTKLIDGTVIAGAHDSVTGINYINANLTADFIEATGHEMSHGYTKSESLADYMGEMTDLVWGIAAWANSDAIKAAKPINLSLPAQQLQNSLLLQGNNSELMENYADHKYAFSFSDEKVFWVRSPDGSMKAGDSYQPVEKPINIAPVETTATKLNNLEQRQIAERQQREQSDIKKATGTQESCALLQNCVSFDPNSEIAKSVIGATAVASVTAATNADILGQPSQDERLTGKIGDINEGWQFGLGQTMVVGAYEIGDWIFDTSADQKIETASGAYNLVVEHPILAGGIFLAGGTLVRMADEITPAASTTLDIAVAPKKQLSSVQRIEANEINLRYDSPVAKVEGWEPPFVQDSTIRRVTTAEGTEIAFKRVHVEVDNPVGRFIVRESEIAHLGNDAEKIRLYLGLQQKPNYISDVYIPGNVDLNVGRISAQPNFGLNSKSGFQYHINDDVNPIWFMRNPPEVLK